MLPPCSLVKEYRCPANTKHRGRTRGRPRASQSLGNVASSSSGPALASESPLTSRPSTTSSASAAAAGADGSSQPAESAKTLKPLTGSRKRKAQKPHGGFHGHRFRQQGEDSLH